MKPKKGFANHVVKHWHNEKEFFQPHLLEIHFLYISEGRRRQ